MARQRQPTPWRQKRLNCGPYSDPKKRAKADRERFRRGKIGAFKRLNDLYLDGIDAERERYIYAIIASKASDGTIKSEDKWTPKDLEAKEKQKKCPRLSVIISRPPLLDIPPTPKLV
ncbi:hypothetical protein BDW72DRAFT_188335 [Aspergillus terricola var. indicus]